MSLEESRAAPGLWDHTAGGAAAHKIYGASAVKGFRVLGFRVLGFRV